MVRLEPCTSGRSVSPEELYEESIDREYDLEYASLEGRGEAEVEHPTPHHHVHPHHPHEAPPASVVVPMETEQKPPEVVRVAKEPWLETDLKEYMKKFKGGLDARLPIPPLSELVFSFFGSFIAILALAGLNEWGEQENIHFIAGSFGASAVLLFALTESKLSQPRAFMGGHFVSAVTGIIIRIIIPLPWVAGPLAMATALLVMQLTATTHPPGGATALIVASMDDLPKWHGWSYLVTIVVGSVVMQIIALLVNNLNRRRVYPTFWW